MSSPIAQAFCLKDGRRNFVINVRASAEDRRFYFGQNHLSNELVAAIRQSYAMGIPPKYYIYGQYGAGKTHTLFNLKYHLEEDPQAAQQGYNVQCKIIECEFRKKTDFGYLYARMMDAIGMEEIRDRVKQYLQAHATQNLEELLKTQFMDGNVARAIHNLALCANAVMLWKWLCAGKLQATDLSALGLTKNVDTVNEMVTTVVAVCRLFQNAGTSFLFMFDEMEGLRNVSDADAQETIHDAIRKLALDDNDSLGFIISFLALREEDGAEFILREDILNRIGRGNIKHLRYMQEALEVESFLQDLFAMLIDPAKRTAAEAANQIPAGLQLYPFTDEARTQFIEIPLQAPTSSTPRNLIKAVNECAARAQQRGSRVIDVEDLVPAREIFVEEA